MNFKIISKRFCGISAFVFCVFLTEFLLYAPFIESPPVFDDHGIIASHQIFDLAQELFSRYTRTFPYFSIGFVHVISEGDLAWNRYLNIFLYGLVILLLFFFLSRTAPKGRNKNGNERHVALRLTCLWFAINPVAVFAVEYLIQRTIVMATLFGLISTVLYLRAQQENRNADLFSAALLGYVAMMCKEHAVLLPLAIVVLTPLVTAWSRAVIFRAAGFVALSLPCMVWAILYRGADIVGTNYEIYSGQVLAQMDLPVWAQTSLGLWLLSIATQSLLFWKYLFLWLVPNPAWMAADLRVDFPTLWSGWSVWLGLAASSAAFAGALYLWWRDGGATLRGRLATAVLFVAVLFAVEFSVVRVQEPFVLYRSFLWMPGYALILAFLLQAADRWAAERGIVWRRSLWAVAVLACLGLFPLTQDRLRSFSSEEALWRDAEAKLPRPDVAGADRIYYNLAGEAFKRKDYAQALDYSDKVILQNPDAFQGYLALGTSLLALRDSEGALTAFDAAERHHPPANFRGYIEFKRCGVYSLRGEKEATIACLRRSAKLGYETAKFHLRMAGVEE